MYASIVGVVEEKTPDTLVINAGGVGYEIISTMKAIREAGAVGQSARVYTYLLVREDALLLYGFASKEEKHMFTRLIGVSGVGPKAAMSILSSLSSSDLALALVTGDVSVLTRAPGIGKKMAQRLILELKEKVGNEELLSFPGNTDGALVVPAHAEAVQALIALGYAAADAMKAINAVAGKSDKVEELVLLALRQLGE